MTKQSHKSSSLKVATAAAQHQRKRRNKYTLCNQIIAAIQQKYRLNQQYSKDLYEQVFINKDPSQLMLWLHNKVNQEDVQNTLIKNSKLYKTTAECTNFTRWYSKEQIMYQRKVLETFLKGMPVKEEKRGIAKPQKVAIKNLLN